MKLNMSQFKKVGADKNSTTMRHTSGHEIKIAHKALSPKMRLQLKSIPQHYDEGGSVQGEDAKAPQAPVVVNVQAPGQMQGGNPYAPQFSKDDLNYLANSGSVMSKTPQAQQDRNYYVGNPSQQGAPQPEQGMENIDPDKLRAMAGLEQTPAPGAMAPQGSQDQGLAQRAPAAEGQDPYGMEGYYGAMQKGIQQQIGGVQAEAKAQGELGRAEADIARQNAADIQQRAMNYEKNVADLTQEHKNFMNDLKTQKIDPNRVMNNMSAFGHIVNFAGLLLGGAGGAGQGNAAQDTLNRIIDRDIDAQKAELGKKENLLNANLKQFGNLRDATDMTRIMQMSLVQSQLQQAAGTSKDPIAQARAQQAIGALNMQMAPLMQQMAMRRSVMGAGGQEAQGQDPSTKIRMLGMSGMMNPSQQEHAFKELKEAEAVGRTRDNILSGFDKLQQINTLGNRTMSPIQSKRQVDAIIGSIVPGLSKETAGRFTEQDAHYIEQLFPAAGDNDQTTRSKRMALEKLISEKMNFPMLQSFGINPGASSRYAPGGQKRIQLGAPVVR